jgi:bifunctional DNA-binding transcriptional regulator/antitoxin component of YhaV-PrlF toxin-antitoxin module
VLLQFDINPGWYYIPSMVRTHITSKGQTTIPSEFRKKWKASQVLWEEGPGGSAVVRPVPLAASFLGIAQNGKPRDPREMEKARQAIADESGEKTLK